MGWLGEDGRDRFRCRHNGRLEVADMVPIVDKQIILSNLHHSVQTLLDPSFGGQLCDYYPTMPYFHLARKKKRWKSLAFFRNIHSWFSCTTFVFSFHPPVLY